MKFHVVTLFEEFFESPLATSLVGKAIGEGLVEVEFHDPRDHGKGIHRQVDDAPFGGGAGMGMMIPGMIYQSMGGAQKGTAKEVEKETVNCPECHGAVSTDSRFCAHCGHQMVVIKKCPRCDKNVTTSANFCPSCGLDLKAELHCAQCQTKLPPGTKFCFNCGTSVNVE